MMKRFSATLAMGLAISAGMLIGCDDSKSDSSRGSGATPAGSAAKPSTDQPAPSKTQTPGVVPPAIPTGTTTAPAATQRSGGNNPMGAPDADILITPTTQRSSTPPASGGDAMSPATGGGVTTPKSSTTKPAGMTDPSDLDTVNK